MEGILLWCVLPYILRGYDCMQLIQKMCIGTKEQYIIAFTSYGSSDLTFVQKQRRKII